MERDESKAIELEEDAPVEIVEGDVVEGRPSAAILKVDVGVVAQENDVADDVEAEMIRLEVERQQEGRLADRVVAVDVRTQSQQSSHASP